MRHRDGEDEHGVRSLALDQPVEVAPPARRDDLPDRLAREPVEGAVLGALLGAAQVPVALQPREPAAQRGVALALAVGRVRRGAPPRRLDRPAAIRRDDEVDPRLVQPLPELPPGRRAAVAEVEVDRGGDGEDPWSAHGRSVGTASAPSPGARPSTRRGRPDRGDRARDDRDVRPDRPVLDVGEVEAHEVVEVEARAAGDLPQARSSPAARASGRGASPRASRGRGAGAAAARRGSSRPRSTFASCGSSSSESRRSTRPTRVTRGSSRILKSAPEASFSVSSSGCCSAASATIVRNLSIPNSRSPTPTRRSTKRIGPRESSLIASGDDEPERRPEDDHDGRDDEVERAFRRPREPAQHRRAELEERHALAGHVLALVDEELGRRRGELHPDARAGGRAGRRRAPTARRSRPPPARARRDARARAAPRAARARRRGPTGPARARSADDVDPDPAPRGAQLALEVGERLALADEQQAPADSDEAHQLERDGVVGRAEAADRERARRRPPSGSARSS